MLYGCFIKNDAMFSIFLIIIYKVSTGEQFYIICFEKIIIAMLLVVVAIRKITQKIRL